MKTKIGRLSSKKNWYARVYVTIPVKTEIESPGLQLSIGAVSLECEGRKFILDSYYSEFVGGAEKTGKCEFYSKLEVDKEIFPKTKEDNYELTIEDLRSGKAKGTLYCSDSDVEEDITFNFEEAKITLVVYIGDEEIKVNLELED